MATALDDALLRWRVGERFPHPTDSTKQVELVAGESGYIFKSIPPAEEEEFTAEEYFSGLSEDEYNAILGANNLTPEQAATLSGQPSGMFASTAPQTAEDFIRLAQEGGLDLGGASEYQQWQMGYTPEQDAASLQFQYDQMAQSSAQAEWDRNFAQQQWMVEQERRPANWIQAWNLNRGLPGGAYPSAYDPLSPYESPEVTPWGGGTWGASGGYGDDSYDFSDSMQSRLSNTSAAMGWQPSGGQGEDETPWTQDMYYGEPPAGPQWAGTPYQPDVTERVTGPRPTPPPVAPRVGIGIPPPTGIPSSTSSAAAPRWWQENVDMPAGIGVLSPQVPKATPKSSARERKKTKTTRSSSPKTTKTKGMGAKESRKK